MTTMQDLATISEVCAGFNIIVTGLLSCLINASECIQNVSLRRKFKKKFCGGHSPSPDPLPLGRGYPSQYPIGAYGASILASSAFDPGWINFANRTLLTTLTGVYRSRGGSPWPTTVPSKLCCNPPQNLRSSTLLTRVSYTSRCL